MTDDRWKRISAIYNDVLAKPEAERSAYLRLVCAGDDLLRREIDALVNADSPDGRWIAYQSNSSGRIEVHIQAFPPATRSGALPKGHWTVSSGGGTQPKWSLDGRELFYVGADSMIMAVAVHATAGGDTLDPGPPVPLFKSRLARGANVPPAAGTRAQYAVSRLSPAVL